MEGACLPLVFGVIWRCLTTQRETTGLVIASGYNDCTRVSIYKILDNLNGILVSENFLEMSGRVVTVYSQIEMRVSNNEELVEKVTGKGISRVSSHINATSFNQ
jgi:hypothetical protein